MTSKLQKLQQVLTEVLGSSIQAITQQFHELTITVSAADYFQVCPAP